MPDAVRVTTDLLRDWPRPAPGDDKEARGRVLVVAGSRSTPGAALLAAESALRAGAGKLKIATAESCAASLAVAVPEAQVRWLREDDEGNIAVSEADRVVGVADECDAVLLGPGFTDVDRATDLLEGVLPRLETGVVIDALATAFVTEDPERLSRLPATIVLTVNPTELARCLGVEEDAVESDLEGHTRTLASRTGSVVVCGGTEKVIVHGDRAWLVEAGNPGLGVSGSGDTQSGMVAGVLARGATPEQAAVWGAFLHAVAGDRLAERVGGVGYLAREIPGEVPGLLTELA
jgi:hydroxyethylthiazole kinase-like uncharacterized protein yjeF